MLTPAEKRRYHRHIILENVGEKGQEKLKNARILIVGAGGLGAPVMQYLAAAGIGKMAIMDDDIVNEDNLHRQVLYGGKDIGKLKTIIARDRLKHLNPLLNFEVMNIKLNEKNADKIIPCFDLIIDATDNFNSRYVINDFCLKYDKPWIYGAIFKYEGQLTVFNFMNGPGLRDLYEEVKDKINIPDPSTSGLFGVLPGMIGSLQANEAIKILTGIGDVVSGKLLLFNMLTNHTEFIRFF